MDVARSIIDRDIARLEERVRALKSRRNELSPIYRLPVEVLCNIFSFAKDNELFFLRRRRGPESWTNFSHVSQHWRSLALSAPELWTNIPIKYPRWAQEMLIRSKRAKLTIRSFFKPWTPKAFETVRSCLYEMNRVEEIDFTAIPGCILEEIFRDLPKSAPQLHTLCIDSPHSAAFQIDDDFIYDTERLQHVELTICKISWDSRLLTGLTRLTLEDSLTANCSTIQVLHALQQMPALTDLYLENSIPDDSEVPSTYPVVDLPCLRVLHISSGVDAMTTVLRHITFPHITFLNLTCRDYDSTQIDFSNFLSVLTTKFLSTLVIECLRLRVSINAQTHGLDFELWALPSSPISAEPLIVQLHMSWPSQQARGHVKVLTCAFDAMSLPFLTDLEITIDELTGGCIDSPTWVKTFGKLPLLKWVCVRGNDPRSFLEALIYKTEAAKKSKTAYHNVSFPKLRYIRLQETNFAWNNPTSMSVDTLLDYLMERCERKAAVRELDLNDCYSISSDDVKRLGEIVVDVIWDGIEREIPEEDDDDENFIEFSSSSFSSLSSEEW